MTHCDFKYIFRVATRTRSNQKKEIDKLTGVSDDQ